MNMPFFGRWVLPLALLMLCGIAHAQYPLPATFKLDIPAQRMTDALNEFARQSGLQILIDWEDSRQMTSPKIVGSFTPEAALEKLLANSGLRYQYLDARTIAVRAQNVAAPTNSGSKNPELNSDFKLAQALSDDQAVAKKGHQPSDENANSYLQEVVVTGSHIRGVPPIGSAVITIGRTDIEKTGYATVQDVVKTLPQNFSGAQNEATRVVGGIPGPNQNYGSNINLRGLGAGATLVTVNGYRLAPAGLGTFVDISSIPLSMIERIEIVPDGASATYGSDAVGGVVNMILRKDYGGAETHLRYGATEDGQASERQLLHLFGTRWPGASGLLSYEYYHRDSLKTADRLFAADSDLRPLGGSNFSTTGSNPGNITRIGTTAVQLAIPRNQNGTALSVSQLLSGAANANFQNARQFQDLMPDQERHSAAFAVTQSVGPVWDVFANGLYTRRDFKVIDARPATTLSIPNGNYYRVLNNLFPGQGVITMNYNLTDDIGPMINTGTSDAYSAIIGTQLHFAESWKAEAAASYASLSEEATVPNLIDTPALNAALGSGALATAFNPFADGSNTNASVLTGLLARNVTVVDTSVRAVDAKMDGALFDIAGGSMRLAAGAELRQERFSASSDNYSPAGALTTTPTPPGRRTVRAAFAEAFIPFVSERNERTGLRLLDVSLSARHENYTDAGKTDNPKFGVRWSPLRGITVRGSYGTSFKAPFLKDVSGLSNGFITTLPATVDPLATGGSTSALILAGGNKDLKPETATTWTAGLQFTPEAIDGLEIEATYFNVAMEDRIASAGNIIPVFASPGLFPGVLLRDPTQTQVDAAIASTNTFTSPIPAPGSVEAIVDGRLRNLSSVDVDGVDLAVKYPLQTAVGQFNFNMSASYLLGFQQRFTETAPVVDNVSTVSNPVDLRVRLGTSWLSNKGWSVAAFANYTDSYKDTISIPNRDVSSWVTVDLQLRYDLGANAPAWLSDTSVSLSAVNAFDRDPPFVNYATGFGFDSSNASPIGRFIALDLSRKW